MKSIITFFFLFLLINATIAQIKVGLPAGKADSSAVLDASNTGSGAFNLGLIPPKVALSSTIVWGLRGTTTVDGMLVYNTASVGTGATAVTPGYYYWFSGTWTTFAQVPTATAGSATFNCNSNTTTISPASPGFTQGTPYTGSITAPFTGGVYGAYPADGTNNAQNGISVSHTAGIINSATGTITYTISGTFTGTTGTPLTFTLTLPGGTQCTVTLPLVATYTASTINCQSGNPVVGTYALNIPTSGTNSNSKLVSITPATAGSYTFGSNTLNGISFTSSGVFTQAQVGTLVSTNLIATGTPSAFGTAVSYTFSAGGQSCTFPVTINNSANFSCTNAAQLQSPIGLLTTGTLYTGSYSIPYTTGNGLTYPATTNPAINGLTFNRVAGTFAAGGGNVVYNLSGTYTGPNSGTQPYTIQECGYNISFGYGDAVRLGLSTSAAAYDAAAASSWVYVTGQEYANAKANLTGTITGLGETDMNGTQTSAHETTPYLWAISSSLLPANNYLFGFSYVTANASSAVANGVSIASSTADRSGAYTTFPANVGLPAITTTANTRYYVLFKKQATISATPLYLGVYDVSGVSFGSKTSATYNNNNYWSSSTGNFPNLTNNTTPLNTNDPTVMMLQYLYTPTKQW